ncbi:MAG: hypothetical protein AB7O96_03790 [Pseudobdellovibrionaceae bacterium]
MHTRIAPKPNSSVKQKSSDGISNAQNHKSNVLKRNKNLRPARPDGEQEAGLGAEASIAGCMADINAKIYGIKYQKRSR